MLFYQFWCFHACMDLPFSSADYHSMKIHTQLLFSPLLLFISSLNHSFPLQILPLLINSSAPSQVIIPVLSLITTTAATSVPCVVVISFGLFRLLTWGHDSLSLSFCCLLCNICLHLLRELLTCFVHEEPQPCAQLGWMTHTTVQKDDQWHYLKSMCFCYMNKKALLFRLTYQKC